MKKAQGIALAVMMMVMSLFVFTGCGNEQKAPAQSQAAEAPKILRIGAIPAEDAQKTRDAYGPLVKYLEKKTGMKVELFVATDYSGVIEAMRSKKLDVAMFGPFSYVLAADKADAEAFAIENRKGSGTTYKSLVVTHPDSGINNIQDLKGRTYAFVDPASTSGNLIPRSFFKKNNFDPEKDFKSIIYAGGHDAVALAVKNRKVDAGSMDDITYGNMKTKDMVGDQNIKIIFQSDPIPGSPWAYRKDLAPELKTKLRDAFLSMDKEDPAALGAYAGKVERYDPVNDSLYNVIRDTAKILNLDLNKK
ncbi:MAG: phosphonate ABC transporter substrate-binding protein [Negativicutes bacterium]